MAYYYPPSLPADLNIGFETFQKLDDSADEHLDALLKTIMALEGETGKKCEADIVTWRGMMTKVCDCIVPSRILKKDLMAKLWLDLDGSV